MAVTVSESSPMGKIAGVLALILLAVCAVALRGWYLERGYRNAAEEQMKATARLVAEKDVQIEQRDARASAQASADARAAAAVRTPSQAAQTIIRYLPAPDQTPIRVVPDTPGPAPELPDSPGSVVLSAAQGEDLARKLLICDGTTAELGACTQDRADLRNLIGSQKITIQAWEKAAKGGTVWSRLVHVAKLAGCAAAGAAVAGEVSSSALRGPYAGVGAGAGVVACSIW